MWRLDDLVAAADALLARGLTTGDLRDEVELMGDRQGLLGRAIAAARFGSESARETHLRLALVRAGLPEPELNLSLYDSRGRFVARLDQAYPQYRVGVEYDGRQHAFDEKQFERDAERWESVRREGWLLVRVLRRHMANDGAAAVSMVREALRESGWIDPGGRRRR